MAPFNAVLGLALLPCYSSSLIPSTLTGDTLHCHEGTNAMLYAFLPLSNVPSTIWPFEFSLSMLAIISEIAFVDSTIRPSELTFSFSLIVSPFPTILACIRNIYIPFFHLTSDRFLYLRGCSNTIHHGIFEYINTHTLIHRPKKIFLNLT